MRLRTVLLQLLIMQTVALFLYVMFTAITALKGSQAVARLRKDLRISSGRNAKMTGLENLYGLHDGRFSYTFRLEYLKKIKEFAQNDDRQTDPSAKLILSLRDREPAEPTEDVNLFFKWCRRPTAGPCRVTLNRSLSDSADAVVIHASKIVSFFPPFEKKPGQVWVARGLEASPYWLPVYRSDAWKGVFDLTMTYRPDADLVYTYGSLVYVGPQAGLDYRGVARNKTRSVAWYVKTCDSYSRREDYVRELQKYIDVDIFGKCGLQEVSRRGTEYYQMLSETYRFYLAFENTFCPYYVTDELLSKYALYNSTRYNHVIPVVRGGFGYRKYIPEGTYIDTADFGSPKELAEYLTYLGNDEAAYAAMLERKAMFATHPILRGEPWCQMCDMLHNTKLSIKGYRDLGAWWDQTACLQKENVNDI